MSRSPPIDDGTVTDEEQDLALRIKEQALNYNRPSSIDMALTLEQQLDAEHEHELKAEATENNNDTRSRPISLDPIILSSIVANLRTDLSRVTQERDALTEQLVDAPAREAELREVMALLMGRCAGLEDELATLRKKSQDDDDAIHMLRTKVEESRRGLMRLQTENKRVSQISIDSGRANAFFGGGPQSSKRASFTLLTGSGPGLINAHRRISSVSDSFPLDMGADSAPASLLLSPSHRTSSLANRANASPSPPNSLDSMPSETESISDLPSQLEALRRERDTALSEIVNVKRELCEAQEAREASEQCVTALRAFIAEHGVGENRNSDSSSGACGILKLPPLPTEKSVDLDEEEKPGRPTMSAGWSFGKLWRADPAGINSSPSPRRTNSTVSMSTTSDASNSLAYVAPNVAAVNPSPATPTSSLSRKLGGFFSRTPSVTSVVDASLPASSASSHASLNPPIVREQRARVSNGPGSDGEDSLETDDGPLEPASPSHENSIDVTCAVNVARIVSSTHRCPVTSLGSEPLKMTNKRMSSKPLHRRENRRTVDETMKT